MKKSLLHKATIVLPLLVAAAPLLAQDAGAAEESSSFFYDKFFGSLILTTAAVVVLAALGTLYRLLTAMIKVQQIQLYREKGLESLLEETKKPRVSLSDRIYKRWTQAVPVEKEEDIIFDHDFDGIRELDNSLPPWWVALFYITIGFAVVYMSYYHFFGVGASSKEQYEMEMEKAEKAIAAFRAQQADLVTEENVTALTADSDLSLGQSIYQVNCVACHGPGGEGGVGPNLTDPYWIHGGGIKNVFRTITYGVPEKGMIAWSAQMRPSDIQKVSSYVLTLQGTNPPNGKEPEGDLYQPEEAEQPDETAEQPDESVGMN